jgi:MoaA/NifB/PqqE/SkfB family radical SAM enzyme
MKFSNFIQYRRILLSRGFLAALWRSRRNIVADAYGLPPPSGPFMAELDVTYRCDARCLMCERWKNQRGGEITLHEYRALAEAFGRMGVYLVTIAGGEPLLREDIFPVIEVFAQHGMRVNVCTNGLSLEEHAGRLCRSGASFITVSLDGDTGSTHDKIRGVPGAYEKILKGVKSLLAHPPGKRPRFRVRMTVCNQNVNEVGRYYRKWHGLADDVLFQPVHQCRDAFYTGRDEEAFHIDPHQLAKQLEGASVGHDGYLDQLVSGLLEHGTFPAHRCYAGVLMVRIDPWGRVYPCLEQHVCVGSLRNEHFQTIWNSEVLHLARRHVAGDGNCRCWYNNTALISHYAKILRWTSAPKLLAGLRRRSLIRTLNNAPAGSSREPSASIDPSTTMEKQTKAGIIAVTEECPGKWISPSRYQS